jgi:hypothetical protein
MLILTLAKLADCQTYVKTLHQMHLHSPSLVLVPDTFLAASSTKRSASPSLLVEYIREEFPGVQLEPVGRRYWNDTGGWYQTGYELDHHANYTQDWNLSSNYVLRMMNALELYLPSQISAHTLSFLDL